MPDPREQRARGRDRRSGARRRLGVLGAGLRGAARPAVGEVCFNTGMTGYQETLTDPSYAGQIITFTFPHIGNVGANPEDMEAASPAALGLVVKQDVTEPANWRAARHLEDWLQEPRRARPRRRGHAGADAGDPRRRAAERRAVPPGRTGGSTWPRCGRRRGLAGAGGDGPRARGVLPAVLSLGRDHLGLGTRLRGAGRRRGGAWWRWITGRSATSCAASPPTGMEVTVVPATATAEEILRHEPDGVFLSNGPGDPAATGGIRGAGDPGRAGEARAGVRHLPRPPAAGAGAGGEDLQAATWATAARTSR